MKDLSLSKEVFFRYFLVTLAIHVASYSTFGVILSYCVAATVIVLLFYKSRAACILFVFSVLVFDDINKFDKDIPPLFSIFTVDFLGLSLSLWLSVILFIPLCVLAVVKHPRNFPTPAPIVVFLLFLLLGASRIYQLGNPAFTPDVGFTINSLLGFFLGLFLLDGERDIKRHFAMILCVFISKYIIFTANGIIASLSGVLYTLKGESGSNYILLPLIFFLLIGFYGRLRTNRGDRVIAASALLFIFTYLLVTISRERILLAGLAVIAFLVIYRKAQIAVFAAAIFLTITVALSEFNPFMYDFVKWKLTSFRPQEGDVPNASSSVRLIELQNIWAEQKEEPYKMAIGTGWGGYFTSENYAFTRKILGTSSFPEEWIQADQFFRPHGTYLYVLLKYGLLGLISFYVALIFFSIKNIYDKSIYSLTDSELHQRAWSLRYIQISIALAIPLVCLVIFTSKLQIITGFLIAMLYKCRATITQYKKD